MNLMRKLIRFGMHKVYSLYAFLIFGRKVYAHGFFRVQMPENVCIGAGCSINSGVLIVGRSKIAIGKNVTLSARVMLIDAGLVVGNSERKHMAGNICIEDDVWIGAGAIILPGVTLGKGCVIGAGSVVTRSVSPYTVTVGNPARQIREIAAPTVAVDGLA